MYLGACSGAMGGGSAQGMAGLICETPNGIAGIRQTLRTMSLLTERGKVTPSIRAKAVELCSGLPPKDYRGEAETLFHFVRDQVRYVRDVSGVETLHDPALILRNLAGDCDDKSILLASLLGSIGARTMFVACGPLPEKMVHVYVRVLIRGRWVGADATEPRPFGWEPKYPHQILQPN